VVVTTVPAPVDTATKTDKTARKDTSSQPASDSGSTSTGDTAKQQAQSSGGPGPSDHGKHGSRQHGGPGPGAVAGARLVGGEVRVRVGGSGVSLSR
jgi:hypothetical protein